MGIRENDMSIPNMIVKELEFNAPLPLVTGIDTSDDDCGPGRKPLFHFEDVCSSLLNRSPRKEIPIGPNHQADVPEFDPEMAKKYHEAGEMERFLGVCVISTHHSILNSSSDSQIDCRCSDHGSVRCVQLHVKEARLNLKEHYGDEKFVDLGMLDMGEEVASRWGEEENFFMKLCTQTPVLLAGCSGKNYLLHFLVEQRKNSRAVQNRSHYLDIDSDDDEWRGSYGGSFVDGVEDDFVVGDLQTFSEDCPLAGNHDANDGDVDEKIDVESSVINNETKAVIEYEQEKPAVDIQIWHH
ncbi:hypothetical protein R6Q57_024743 [Mikania cordata]